MKQIVLILLFGLQFDVFAAQKTELLGSPRQLTFDGRRSGEGYFNADGTAMIFQSEREPGNPFYQMYQMELKTGATQRLTPGTGKATCGWFVPGHRRAIFSSSHLDPEFAQKAQDEYARRASGKPQPYAWSYDPQYDIFEADFSGEGAPKLKRLTDAVGYDAEGAVSPDGQWIVFASNREAYARPLSPEDARKLEQDPAYFIDLYIMRSDGSELRRLTEDAGYEGGPFFSPDSKSVVFRKYALDGRTAEIQTVGIDGQNRTQLTHLGAQSWAPFYHPSGDYVVFTSDSASPHQFDLFIVGTQGTQAPVRVAQDADFDGLPVFLPDGNRLSWSSTRGQPGGQAQIFIATWDDAAARQALGLPPAPKSEPTPTAPRPARVSHQQYRHWVERIASSDTEGRLTGSAGIELARQRIEAEFQRLGLLPIQGSSDYRHGFEFRLPGTPDVRTDWSLVARLPRADGVPRPILMVGAHLDHLGRGALPSSRAREDERGQIHNGADDNASGVAAILEIARLISELQKAGWETPYDIAFGVWSGEELGLLGSTQFAETHKDRSFVGYVNADMIGRLRDRLLLQGVGSAQEWRAMIERVAMKNSQLSIAVAQSPYVPTDTTSFYRIGAPVLTAFTGDHDEYHTPRDVPETLNIPGAAQITEVLLDLVLELSAAPPLQYVKLPPPSGMTPGGRKIYLGTIPDYSGSVQYGLSIRGVQPDSPASRAGLRTGDVVVRLGAEDVRGIDDYTRALETLAIGVETTIDILRSGAAVRLKITPTERPQG